MKKTNQLFLLYLLFFLSGIPALIYQLVWQRSLFAIYGVNIQSITAVVADFMLGLGIGALVGGWFSTIRFFNLLRLFGTLELLIGIIGLVSLSTLNFIGYHTLEFPFSTISIIVFLLLLLPTIMMGASLPILVAFLVKREPHVGKSVGALYAANTFGAAGACFAVAYFLMRQFGQSHTILLAASINLLIGFTAFLVSYIPFFSKNSKQIMEEIKLTKNIFSQSHFVLMLFIALVTGYMALSYEILWTHIYSFTTGAVAPDFAQILGYYLLGIAFGALLCAACFSSKENTLKQANLNILLIILWVSSMVSFLVLPAFALVAQLGNIQYFLIIVGIASTFFGILFPLINYISVDVSNYTGLSLGLIYFANIIGSTLGALLTGFLLLNILPAKNISVLLFVLGMIISIIVLFFTRYNKRNRAIILFVLFITAFSAIIFSNCIFYRFYEKLFYKNNYTVSMKLKSVVENSDGIIAITPDDAVYGNGVYDGYFNINPMNNENLIARAYLIPLFAMHPTNVLMIGLSSGSWAQVIAHNPEVKHLTVVEINPGYLKLIPQYSQVRSLLSNPKVTMIIDDGRRWLLRHNQEKFDLIVMNTTFHWRIYTSLLLSKDFYKIVQDHLTENGIFYYNTTSSLDVAKTALQSFSYVNRLYNFIIASNQPIILDNNNLRKILISYQIDNRKIFDLTKKQDEQILNFYMNFSQTINRSPIKAGMESQKSLTKRSQQAHMITDDNMYTEWHFE